MISQHFGFTYFYLLHRMESSPKKQNLSTMTYLAIAIAALGYALIFLYLLHLLEICDMFIIVLLI